MPEPETVSAAELMRSLQEFKTDMREDLKEIRSTIANLNHVHVDVYAADRRADSDRHRDVVERLTSLDEAVRGKADSSAVGEVRTLAMWSLGLVGTITFGAIVLAILAAVFKAGG